MRKSAVRTHLDRRGSAQQRVAARASGRRSRWRRSPLRGSKPARPEATSSRAPPPPATPPTICATTVDRRVLPLEPAGRPRAPSGHRRVEVAAGDAAHGVRHGEDRQAERQRDAERRRRRLRSRGEDRRAAAAEHQHRRCRGTQRRPSWTLSDPSRDAFRRELMLRHHRRSRGSSGRWTFPSRCGIGLPADARSEDYPETTRREVVESHRPADLAGRPGRDPVVGRADRGAFAVLAERRPRPASRGRSLHRSRPRAPPCRRAAPARRPRRNSPANVIVLGPPGVSTLIATTRRPPGRTSHSRHLDGGALRAVPGGELVRVGPGIRQIRCARGVEDAGEAYGVVGLLGHRVLISSPWIGSGARRDGRSVRSRSRGTSAAQLRAASSASGSSARAGTEPAAHA